MTLPVSNKNNRGVRPIVSNRAYSHMRLFFDTGAGVPVWVAGLDSLLRFFPRADNTGYMFILGGFGGSGSAVPVYKLPEFIIEDTIGNNVKFYGLHVVLADRDDPYTMIVSYNMFKGMQVIFDQQESAEVHINNPKQIYVAEPSFYSLKDRTYLTGQAVYAQNSSAEQTAYFT